MVVCFAKLNWQKEMGFCAMLITVNMGHSMSVPLGKKKIFLMTVMWRRTYDKNHSDKL